VEEGRTTSITRTGKEIHQSVSSLPKRQKSAIVPYPEAGESRPLLSPHFFNIQLVLFSHHVKICSLSSIFLYKILRTFAPLFLDYFRAGQYVVSGLQVDRRSMTE